MNRGREEEKIAHTPSDCDAFYWFLINWQLVKGFSNDSHKFLGKVFSRILNHSLELTGGKKITTFLHTICRCFNSLDSATAHLMHQQSDCCCYCFFFVRRRFFSSWIAREHCSDRIVLSECKRVEKMRKNYISYRFGLVLCSAEIYGKVTSHIVKPTLNYVSEKWYIIISRSQAGGNFSPLILIYRKIYLDLRFSACTYQRESNLVSRRAFRKCT